MKTPPPRGEIFIEFLNRPTSWSLEVTVSTENVYWDADYNNSYHYLSEDYDGSTETITHLDKNYIGIDLCYDDNEADFIIGLGLYKIKIEYDNVTSYFYVDYRTSDLPECGSGGVDVNFDYNMGLKQFRQNGGGSSINGTTQKFWDHRVYCDKETEDFELNLTVSNQNNNPYLEWNEYNDQNIDGYNVYRKVTTSSGTITYVEFTTSTFYLDEDFYIDPPKTPGDDEVEYWIAAKISSTEESLEGNHVQITGTSIIQWKISDKESNSDLSYKLNQNYPNPFNPSTIITFSIKEESFVNLRIIDILGRNIITLVNENLPEGRHQVEFNGSSMVSGIYFYEISANEFRDVKKLILIK
jgi:Secretion system C-terminal sorting domain